MRYLTKDNCPDVAPKKLDAVNELSDEELRVEIAKGRRSRFSVGMIPILEKALRLREEVVENEKREVELEISRESNRIALAALEQSKLANKKSDQARFWAAFAVLISLLISVIGWFLYGK